MDRIIMMNNDKILNMDIFEFIESQYKYRNNFIVCNVTKDEYKTMVKQIEKDGCLKEKYSRIDNMDIGYNKFRYMLAYNPKTNVIHLADYNNPDKIGSYIIDETGISYNEKMKQFYQEHYLAEIMRGPKVYTTASYDDVINYYTELKRKKEIPNSSLEKIINKIIDNPKEFYIKIYGELTYQEREYLKSLIECKTCKNCSNMSCRVESHEKLTSNACIAWENQELIGKQKLLYKNR